jgi:hypothetical protein
MDDRIDANSPIFSSVDPGATELPLELGDGLSRSREVAGVGGFAATVRSAALSVTQSRGMSSLALLAGESSCRLQVPTTSGWCHPDELHRLANEVGPAWRFLNCLGGIMGLRFGEATALRVTDLRVHAWLPAVDRLGLDGLTFHGLRHSAAT